MQFTTREGACNGVVTLNERREIDIQQRLVLNSDPAIDDAQIDLGRMTKDQRGQGVMDGPTCKRERIEPIADEVCRHAGREVANVITAKHGSAASGCQPECFAGGHGCRVAQHAMQQERLSRFGQQMRAII